MSARQQLGMQLPACERSSGEVETSRPPTYIRDARVPAPLRRQLGDGYSELAGIYVAAHSPYFDDACPDGRHLFDVIESIVEHEIGEPHTDEFVGYEYEFRARLTCVRCGVIREWEGRRTDQVVGRVTVAPMVAGDMVAQQVSAQKDDGWPHSDTSTWLVYSDGVEIGVIGWARGQRGRAFHKARLHSWPDGQTVEGADPAAALRKLGRATKAASSSSAARELVDATDRP